MAGGIHRIVRLHRSDRVADVLEVGGLEAVGAAFDVPRKGAEIIDEVASSLGLWETEAETTGLDPEWIRQIGKSFRLY